MADKYGQTPLHYAAKSANLEVVKYLVEKGADINMADKVGAKTVGFAAENNDIEGFKCIVVKGGTCCRLLDKVNWVIYFLHKGISHVIFDSIRLLSNLFGSFIDGFCR